MEDLTAIERRAGRIKLLLTDCDGVLTDGSLTLLENGDEQKTFNVRDGQGIVLLHRAGLQCGIISGRNSSFVQRRAAELGIKPELVCQGSADKIKDFDRLLARSYPRYWGVHSELSFIYTTMGEFEKAVEEGLESVRLEPRVEPAYRNLESAYVRLDRLVEAREVLAKAQSMPWPMNVNLSVSGL